MHERSGFRSDRRGCTSSLGHAVLTPDRYQDSNAPESPLLNVTRPTDNPTPRGAAPAANLRRTTSNQANPRRSCDDHNSSDLRIIGSGPLVVQGDKPIPIRSPGAQGPERIGLGKKKKGPPNHRRPLRTRNFQQPERQLETSRMSPSGPGRQARAGLTPDPEPGPRFRCQCTQEPTARNDHMGRCTGRRCTGYHRRRTGHQASTPSRKTPPADIGTARIPPPRTKQPGRNQRPSRCR